MFDADDTVQADLRGGTSPWLAGRRRPLRMPLDRSLRCDVLVVGAGITGALMAEHLTALGRQVCLIDRERAGFGSTAASTAMLQWEIDRSLSELAGFYGFEQAARIYHRSLQAVTGLRTLAEGLGLNCGFRERHSLYLAGPETDPRTLVEEHAMRARAGLPGLHLDHADLMRAFGFDRPGAIVSPGSADADPLRLAHALIEVAIGRGAAVYDAEAKAYDSFAGGVMALLDNGCEIEARAVVLATGYVMPDFLTSEMHSTASSWAIATVPQTPDALWRDGVLIWEASDPYLYARTTADNRIIIGGEDDDGIIDPEARDALMPAKAATLQGKLAALCPNANTQVEMVWSGAFGETQDGLPLIGAVPGKPGLFAAYGYGGNGITFSYLASRMIGRMILGERQPWFDDFAIDRPLPRPLAG